MAVVEKYYSIKISEINEKNLSFILTRADLLHIFTHIHTNEQETDVED